MEEKEAQLADAVVSLLHQQHKINRRFESGYTLGDEDFSDLRDRLRDILRRVRELAQEFGPNEFEVQLGISGSHVKFRWSSEEAKRS